MVKRFGFSPLLPEMIFAKRTRTVPPPLFREVEVLLGRSLFSFERDELVKLYQSTYVLFEMAINAPVASEVRKELIRISRKGSLVAPEQLTPSIWKAHQILLSKLEKEGMTIGSASPEQVASVALNEASVVGQFVRKGRGQNDIARALLWELADVFERLGGYVSASYKPQKEKRDSPFLRFVRIIARHVIAPVRVWIVTGLDDRAALLLKLRRALKEG
jgi:hypothetical protein